MSRLFAFACLASITLIVSETDSLGEQGSKDVGSSLHKQSSPLFLLHLLKLKKKIHKIEKIETIPPNADCVCVPYYLCSINGTVTTDQVGSIVIRYRRCTGDQEVCCRLINATTTAKPTPTTMKTTPTTKATTTTMKPTTTTVAPVIFPIPETPIGRTCVCVLISQCDPYGVVGTSGVGVINPRLLPLQCGSNTHVCCRPASVIVYQNPPVVPQQVCMLCGNAIQCNNGVVVPINIGLVNTLGQQSCQVPATCCGGSNPLYSNGIPVVLGPVRYPNTPQACYCMKTWLCSAGNTVNWGVGAIDPRFSACHSADETCCRPSDLSDPRGRDIDEGFSANIVTEGVSFSQEGCGLRNASLAPAQPYPVDSGRTYLGEFPWMVAILSLQADGKYMFLCGGSLITNTAVLTAAHCIASHRDSRLVARVGQLNLDGSNQPLPYQEANVKTVVTHPLFYRGGLFNDIAVVILAKPFNKSVNVVTVCVPQQGTIIPAGTRCLGTGWGKNTFDGVYQNELRKVELPIVDRTECQYRLRTTKLGPYFQLHSSFICAGGESHRDTCTGDGGGPLVYTSASGQFIQAGIVSWGIGCGSSTVPAVYTNVAHYTQWINVQLATYGTASTMWKALLTLALAIHCLAAPQLTKEDRVGTALAQIFGLPEPQQKDGDCVNSKLVEIFGTQPPETVTQAGPTDRNVGTSINCHNPQSTTRSTPDLHERNPTTQPNPVDCECVPYYLCRSGKIVTDASGVLDVRQGAPCEAYNHTCCNLADKIDPDKPTLTPPMERKGCGQRHVTGVGIRISGDENSETQFAEFPWMVAILNDEMNGNDRENKTVFTCGGSLIHYQAILTAAHCVKGVDASTLLVRAGEWDTLTRNEIYPHQDRRVQKVIIHDKFYSGGLFYDYAILILTKPFEPEENVDVVCLPDPNVIYDGSRCFATGWGKDKFGVNGQYQAILKKIELPMVPRNKCQSDLRNTKVGKHFQLHETFICAGGEPGKDACKGDGGGPLVCRSKNDPNRYQQAGIVAWGIGCANSSIPGVYANVAYARNWIDNQMAFHNLDNTVYNL
ncbi:ovochymase-1 [Halictus rubicundus]|uniref:ovochymase-1 n=1 Tax=Halictus rubicundus TaxID=77578 RepID=UPI0040352BEC